MRQIDISGAAVQLSLPEADDRRLTSWLPEIVARFRPTAPQQANNGEIRVGSRGSLALYADGGWWDYEADRGGPGALSFAEYELEDTGKARRFAAEWLSRSGFGSFVPETISAEAAKARAELFAQRAREALANMIPAEQWSSTAPPVSALNLLARGLPGPYPAGLLGHLDDARFAETALVAVLTGIDGAVLGVQLGYLTLPNGEKSSRIPQRAIFYITLDPEERKTALFRIQGRPRAEGENAFPDTTFIVEGIEKAIAVHLAYPYVDVIGLPGIGRLRRIPPIKGAVIIIRDGDEPKSRADKSLIRGVDHLLLTGTSSVHVTDTPRGLDADKIGLKDGIEALRELIRTADIAGLSAAGYAEKIASTRNPLERDEVRAEALKSLRPKKVRASTLDAVVDRLRAAAAEDTPIDKTQELGPEPWPEPVTDIAAVLNIASAEIGQYVIAPQVVRDAAVLWAVHTFFLHHERIKIKISPRYEIRAVSPECGKSTLLELLNPLTWRPYDAVASLTTAVVFRMVDQSKPTLLLDEIDDLLRAHRHTELGSILRASHKSNAKVPRSAPTPDGKDWTVKWFPAFMTYAYTATGKLDAAMQSRAISVTLKRAKPSELKTSRRDLIDGESEVLQICGRKIARWAMDLTELPQAQIPAGISHRGADNWRPLLRAAEAIKGDWPQRGRAAALTLHGRTVATGNVTLFLTDVFRVLGDRVRMGSQEMVDALLALEEPSLDWSIAYNNNPINVYWLRDRLKGLVDAPDEERRWKEGGKVIRGYQKAHFQDAFERYLSIDSATPADGEGKPDGESKPDGAAAVRGAGEATEPREAPVDVETKTVEAEPTIQEELLNQSEQVGGGAAGAEYIYASTPLIDTPSVTAANTTLNNSDIAVTDASVTANAASVTGTPEPAAVTDATNPVTDASVTASSLIIQQDTLKVTDTPQDTGEETNIYKAQPTSGPDQQPNVESEIWLPVGDFTKQAHDQSPNGRDVSAKNAGNGLDGDAAILAKLRAANRRWFGPVWLEQAGVSPETVDRLLAEGIFIRHPTVPSSVGFPSTSATEEEENR
jgi:hypothetical protein